MQLVLICDGSECMMIDGGGRVRIVDGMIVGEIGGGRVQGGMGDGSK